MRFVLLSIEFDAGTFSGNGVYACSQARALTQLGHQVLVVAGAPPGFAEPSTAGAGTTAQQPPALASQILHVPLPTWGRLDAGCAWREYAAGVAAPAVAAAVSAFRPDAVLGVDWHSVGAYDALAAAAAATTTGGSSGSSGGLPYIFLNYRVYHRTASAAELAVVEAQEAAALRLAACSLVLSRADAAYLRRHFPAVTSPAAGAAPLHVLLPALRADMEALPPPPGVAGPAAATAAAMGSSEGGGSEGQADPHPQQQPGQQPGGQPGGQRRRYLACVVRLSPEKEPHRFVELLEELQRRGALERHGAVPLMAGAGWATEYGAQLRARLERHLPQAVIHTDFLGPGQLAAIFAATLLNLHPPTYDAYGMSVVEAGAFGAPSLVQGGGHVGATDLLSEAAGEVLCCDMDAPLEQLADRVEALLADPARLAAVGRAAAAKARSWTEHGNAAALVGHVQAALAPAPAGTGA